MSSLRKISPASSQDVNTTHTRTPRRSRSVCSAKSNTSLRLTTLISDSFKLTPIAHRQSVLNDETDIDIPGRKTWWKKLGENSRDVMDVLENRDIAEVNNVAEEFDVEILSQEKKNYSTDLPESSDGESINSIVIPQRKLFTQKEIQAQKKFGHIIDNRETLAKLQKSHIDDHKAIEIAPKNLFNLAPKPRTKPAFPAALLNISSKTVNKTNEMPTAEVNRQVRNLFGNRPGNKRKNMFADFIVSESEDEIPDIQPKLFGFRNNKGQKRRESCASDGIAHSPTSTIELEMDDWRLLPSSTMVEHQLEEACTTPVKRAKISKLSEPKETVNTNISVNKTKQSIKSKNTSKSNINLSSTSKIINDLNEENNHTANNSNNFRLTRNKSKSIRESTSNEKDHSKITNKSKNPLKPVQSISDKDLVQEDHKSQHEIDDDDEDFTLEYENDDEQVNPTNINKSNKINEKESYNQLIEGDNDGTNTTAIEHHTQKILSKIDSFEDGLKQKTGNKKETNEKIKTQNNRHEQDNSNNHIEEQVQPNEQQNQSLMKNNDKQKNYKRNDDTNQPQDIVKPKKHTLTDKQHDSDHQPEPEESTAAKEDVDTNQSLNNEPNESNRSEHEESMEAKEEEEINESHNNEENDSNQAEPEESREVQEGVDTNQSLNNEPSENNTSEHEESIEAEEDEEIDESLNNEENDSNQAELEESREVAEDVHSNQSLNIESNENNASEHEESIEAEEEEEINESFNNEENDSDQAEGEEAKEEIETNQTLNDEQSDNDEAEEEAGESDSETDEQNEEVSDDAESDDNQQNESILSQNVNIQEEESMESEQEQSDVDDNEVAGDESVPDESDDHDTTGRHRKKNDTIVKSPEAILHDKISEMKSFTAEGRKTSIRKTNNSLIKNINIRPSLAPVRESTGLTDGTRDSSAEGSGWDSHRTTRKTIRLTMGKDFTIRKSLRALVMEKSAKQYIEVNEDEMNADNTKTPQANSTELPAFESYQETEPMHVDETVEEPSDHEVSARTKQTTLELYLEKIKEETIERKRQTEEKVRAYLKAPPKSTFNSFKMPQVPVKRTKVAQNKPKPKQTKSSLFPLDMLPPEVLEDMKYKPPKRFQPRNASWITKRLYKYVEDKLEPKYDYKARIRAERFMEMLYEFSRDARRARGPSDGAVDALKKEMARLNIIKTHFEFYCFFNKFMPREIRIKVVPDVVNKISLPKTGIFSDILQ